MLATGHSAAASVNRLKQAGATQINFVCLLAAPEGLRTFRNEHPDVPIFTAAIDRGLDENGYIRPGLGDAGDRLFGTKSLCAACANAALPDPPLCLWRIVDPAAGVAALRR